MAARLRGQNNESGLLRQSPAAHARTLLRGFSRMSRRGNGVQIPEIVYAFGPQLNAFMAVGILLKYFRRKLLQFE